MLTGKYQWIKGENKGTVENITETKDEWVIFQSGRRINKDIVNEFMLPINHPEQRLSMPSVEPEYKFSSGDSNDDIIEDPDTGQRISLKELRRQEKFNNKKNSTSVNVQSIEHSTNAQIAPIENDAPVKESPITLLISKSKKDKVKVSYEFNIDIPKKDVYDIINQSFDIELNDEIISIVLASIDNKTLKKDIEKSITKTITNYYKSK